jgi:hypothetical protein
MFPGPDIPYHDIAGGRSAGDHRTILYEDGVERDILICRCAVLKRTQVLVAFDVIQVEVVAKIGYNERLLIRRDRSMTADGSISMYM